MAENHEDGQRILLLARPKVEIRRELKAHS
jgi:hypothetical protein